MYANPNVIGRAKTKDCRMIPGHSSPPLSRPAIFLSVCAFFLDLFVRMPFQGNLSKSIYCKKRSVGLVLNSVVGLSRKNYVFAPFMSYYLLTGLLGPYK